MVGRNVMIGVLLGSSFRKNMEWEEKL